MFDRWSAWIDVHWSIPIVFFNTFAFPLKHIFTCKAGYISFFEYSRYTFLLEGCAQPVQGAGADLQQISTTINYPISVIVQGEFLDISWLRRLLAPKALLLNLRPGSRRFSYLRTRHMSCCTQWGGVLLRAYTKPESKTTTWSSPSKCRMRWVRTRGRKTAYTEQSSSTRPQYFLL